MCNVCKDWGRTVTQEEALVTIPCPQCKRLTYPNLGVNCPAGCAVALASHKVTEYARRRLKIDEN